MKRFLIVCAVLFVVSLLLEQVAVESIYFAVLKIVCGLFLLGSLVSVFGDCGGNDE